MGHVGPGPSPDAGEWASGVISQMPPASEPCQKFHRLQGNAGCSAAQAKMANRQRGMDRPEGAGQAVPAIDRNPSMPLTPTAAQGWRERKLLLARGNGEAGRCLT